jgi:transcriptional regulator with XRE-family HTH domain
MYQLLPPLSTEEYERLRLSIINDGCLVPIEVDEDGNILDGHNRHEICTKEGVKFEQVIRRFTSELDKQAYVYKINLSRRHLSNEQKKDIRKQQIELAKQFNRERYSQERIAEVLGIDQSTISRWLNTNGMHMHNTSIDNNQYVIPTIKIGKKEKEAIFAQLDSGLTQEQVAANLQVTQQRISQIKKNADKKKEAESARANELKVTDDNILIGDMRVLGQSIPDNSIDLIFTDPPYGKKYISDYEELAKFAARVLKPGASLLYYTGQSVLPEVLAVTTPHLNYWWTICMEHTGQNQRLAGKFVYVEWKPIIWLVKGKTRRSNEFVSDFVKSKQDKNHHEWGQGIEEALYYIERLTIPGELVCDPFLGGGTTCVAARKLDRRYLAFEKDEKTAKKVINEMSALICRETQIYPIVHLGSGYMITFLLPSFGLI